MSIQSFQSFKKLPKSYFFGAKSKSASNEPVMQRALENMTIVLIAHDRWPVSISSLRSFTFVTVAQAISGVEPDPIPAIAIAGIVTIVVTIVGIVNNNVSI